VIRFILDYLKLGLSRLKRNKWKAAFASFVILETLAVLIGSTTNIFMSIFVQGRTSPAYYYYVVLIILTAIAMLYFAVESIFYENTFQLVGYYILTLSILINMTIAIAVDYFSFGVMFALVTTIFWNILCVLIVYPLFKSFGWKLFRSVGTNRNMISLYRNYQAFLTILKIDIFSIISIIMLLYFFVIFEDNWTIASYSLYAFVFFLSILFIPVIIFGVRKEYKTIVALYAFFSLIIPIYLIYKGIDIWVNDYKIRLPDGNGIYMVNLTSSTIIGNVPGYIEPDGMVYTPN